MAEAGVALNLVQPAAPASEIKQISQGEWHGGAGLQYNGPHETCCEECVCACRQSSAPAQSDRSRGHTTQSRQAARASSRQPRPQRACYGAGGQMALQRRQRLLGSFAQMHTNSHSFAQASRRVQGRGDLSASMGARRVR